ncbi:hypothetical protein BUJ38_0016395, partial [Salmonella enterica subsp. enterica serovar Muenchen]
HISDISVLDGFFFLQAEEAIGVFCCARGSGEVYKGKNHPIIYLVKKIGAFLPLLGILTIFFPNNRQKPYFYGVKRSALTACTS